MRPGGEETTVIAVIGDVHGRWDRLDRVIAEIERVRRERGLDLLLLAGDIGGEPPWRLRGNPRAREIQLDSIASVLERVARLGLPLRWVPGNHDPREVPLEGNVDGRVERVAGLRIGGIGGSGPDRFGFPYEWDEDEIRALELPPCDVLVSHTPPARSKLDLTRGRQHAGSEAIRERVERHRGAMVCGHIHEAAAIEVIGDCLCVNAGGLGAPWGAAQLAFLTRTEGGGEIGYAAELYDLESGEISRGALRLTGRGAE